ncbi:protein kinase [Rhodococcus sp. NPDC003318]|uniref:protein kinase domain-containing protein n=1 Tax=Rhodococcus sp. NPDC003318 TaxID=3364503 RepID=UPI0036C14573
MADSDPLRTQRTVTPAVAAELSLAGFDDAEEIGRGGFGVVYRCVQPSLDRTVAVKVLMADLDEETLARFVREQRAMGRLTGHPNIVGVLQAGTTDRGRPYIVMQYHERDSLDAHLRRDGPLDLAETLRLGVRIAGALETAHRLGVVHRDVKPANILLTDYGEPALTDFGIAHILGGFTTATGTVTGSPAFTAPEVLEGDPPSAASDVYGLGATLFSVLTGHAAFERRVGEQVVAQFLRITTEPVPDLRERGIADDVSAVVERAMSADPDRRPATAADLGDELRRVQVGRGLVPDDMALLPAPGSPRREERPPGTPPVRPLAAATSATGELPLELTSFVGRRRELTEVKETLSTSRLVTLTGIGGVGKTRLAFRAAADLRRGFRDGVCRVELDELRDRSLLVHVVATALGVRNPSARPFEDVVVEFLASRQLLLVLDNCEQVVDAAAELAGNLLRSCPELRILATSREALGVGGESVLAVPPLTVPDPDYGPSAQGARAYDAITLFEERAAAAVPGFEVTDANRATVAEICRRLDGLPLPIELATARLRAMSPEQVLERLSDRYRLLTRGPRGVPARQQTLRLSVDWSYELCTEQDQRLWAHLAVFAGSFELDAAHDVCAGDLDPEEVMDTVASLVDKSIVIRGQSGDAVRYRMLETLRAYGREKAEQAGELGALHRRHHEWYRQLVSDAEAGWIGPRQVEWIERLDREQSNLREAMEFGLTHSDETSTAGPLIAVGLFPFWAARGRLSEGRNWLGRALARRPPLPVEERIRALYAAGVLAGMQGDLPAGKALMDEGQELAARGGDRAAYALIAGGDGMLALYGGDLPRAHTRLSDAHEWFAAQDELSRVGVAVLQALAWTLELQGDATRAAACHEQVLETTRARHESVYRSYSLWGLGVAVWRQGDRTRAARLLEQGLRLTRMVDDALIAAADLEALAWIESEGREPERAAVLLGAAESLRRAVGSSTLLFLHLLVHHEQCERRVRAALGTRAFEAAQRTGRALNFAGAVTYALRESPPAASTPADSRSNLTKRERQVADLVARGLTNRAIAAQLVIAQRTAEGHVEHILTKLGFTSRAQIAAWVVEQADGASA